MNDKTATVAAAVPRHVAIIMDGNNRWARKRLMPGVAGHKAGVDAVKAAIEVCAEEGIFSILSRTLGVPIFQEQAMKISIDAAQFSPTEANELRKAMADAEALTAECRRLTLVVAANYGGQWDIAQAARQLAARVASGELEAGAISENDLESCLSTADWPLPDLCIRTGGERRISNFLLWQLAYAELYFSDLYWPDFKQDALREALADFARRQRRFGKTSEQILGAQT